MNAAEKTAVLAFLNTAGDYLKDGYARHRENAFLPDSPEFDESGGFAGEKHGLPLAYTVEEGESGIEDFDVPQENQNSESSLETLAGEISACRLCGLAATRTYAVPGEGAENPLVMVIGEGPGADEDASGRPFVGNAGKLLDKMLSSIGLFREKNCFIANMVKCRPPGNRDPLPDETSACRPYLERQIMFLRPKIILCAGRVAAQGILETRLGINALRGKFAEFKLAGKGGGGLIIPVLPTFHPSAVLRDESLKRPAWEDLKLLRSRLEFLQE